MPYYNIFFGSCFQLFNFYGETIMLFHKERIIVDLNDGTIITIAIAIPITYRFNGI